MEAVSQNNNEEAITPAFQSACFKALWCCLTGIFIAKDIYFGGIMLLAIVVYLLLVPGRK